MKRIKIVINGCFDIFHAGHEYLIYRSLDIIRPKDVLVAINTDESVKKLKGKERPAICLADRADEVQRCIDRWTQKNLVYVRTKIVPFTSEEELERIINEFQPTVIVKGSDRPDVRKIVGAKNWPTMIIPRISDKHGDISTSRILKFGHK